MNTRDSASPVDAETLARLQHLQLVARQAATGAMAGLHSTKRRGASVEFAEHKEYAPGDDVRRIDWRAYGRLDRYYLKEYQDEANLRLYLVLDHSGSMGYGNKLAYARTLAGSLAHLSLSQRDAAGLMMVSDGTTFLPPRTRTSHLEEMFLRLVQAEPRGAGKLAESLGQLSDMARGRGVCVIVSDMLDRSPDPVAAMQRLVARGFDVSVLHVQHPDERDFPFETPAFFASMESSARVFAQPRLVRETYVREMARHCEQLEQRLTAARIDYHRCDTSAPAADALSRFLSLRAALLRARA